MLIRKLLPLFIAALLIVPVFAFSEMQEIKDYKVKGGSTLLGHIKSRVAGSILMAKDMERKSWDSESRQNLP